MASVGQELLNVPFPEMVVQLAGAIAEGQYKLDLISCDIAKMMAKQEVVLPSLKTDSDEPFKTTMLGAGFQPTFYQFTDTIIEVKMAITMSKTTETKIDTKAKAGFGCFSASVNGSYSSKYSYSVEGSSLLRTKITPVPPNTFIEKYIELKAKLMQAEIEAEVRLAEAKVKQLEAEQNQAAAEEEANASTST
jgi:hypothetical protein